MDQRTCENCLSPIPDSKPWNTRFCERRCKNRASQKRRTADGREAVRSRERYPQERERRIAYAIAYFQRNPHVAQATKRNRRSIEAKGRVTPSDWKKLCHRFGGRCAYCRAKAPLTIDHVVPLVRGGTNFIGNILPACRSCNCRKQGRFIMEWRMGKSRRTGGRLHALEA